MPEPVPSNEQIEVAARQFDDVLARLPANGHQRAARHFLEVAEKRAHQAREAGPEPAETYEEG